VCWTTSACEITFWFPSASGLAWYLPPFEYKLLNLSTWFRFITAHCQAGLASRIQTTLPDSVVDEMGVENLRNR